MKNKKEITWADLKKFCNGIKEEFLDGKVLIVGEERGMSPSGLKKAKQDYADQTGDGLEPRSAYIGTGYDKSEFDSYIRIYKGQPVICIDDINL